MVLNIIMIFLFVIITTTLLISDIKHNRKFEKGDKVRYRSYYGYIVKEMSVNDLPFYSRKKAYMIEFEEPNALTHYNGRGTKRLYSVVPEEDLVYCFSRKGVKHIG